MVFTMPAAVRTGSGPVEVNGFALREIRLRSAVQISALATQVGVTRAYLTKIELGYSPRVSPAVFQAIIGALGIGDRRALLASPHAGGAAHVA